MTLDLKWMLDHAMHVPVISFFSLICNESTPSQKLESNDMEYQGD